MQLQTDREKYAHCESQPYQKSETNRQIVEFFDNAARQWDAYAAVNAEAIGRILDAARVFPGKNVLDVGCGTGVLEPFLLHRGVKSVTAVDISSQMLELARKKYGADERVCFVNCDISDFTTEESFDCVIVHNAFPHLLETQRAVGRLKELTKRGGRLTVAHSLSREAVLRCHEGVKDISFELPQTDELSAYLAPGLTDFFTAQDEQVYIVSATKLCVG